MFREELVSLLAGTTQKRSANSVANLRWFYPKRRVRLDSKYRFYASFLLVFIAKDEVNVAALALLSGFVIIIVAILWLWGLRKPSFPARPFIYAAKFIFTRNFNVLRHVIKVQICRTDLNLSVWRSYSVYICPFVHKGAIVQICHCVLQLEPSARTLMDLQYTCI